MYFVLVLTVPFYDLGSFYNLDDYNMNLHCLDLDKFNYLLF
jgi:hypothetical protein